MAPKYLSGVAFGVLLYLSSTLGAIFFMTPFLPLVALYPPLARTVADYLVASWKTFAVGLYELVFGVKVVFTGEPSPPQHGVVVVMNHRTRLDWLFYFSYELRYGNIAQGKIILKSLLKHIPGPGWAMQFGMFLFLQRRWEVDKPMLTRVIQYFQALRYSPQILIFPEGTDLTEKTQAKSDEFARKENLQPYRYVLHPRTTGFVYLVRTLMEGDSVSSLADITIAYPQNLCQNESDIIKGDFPREIHFHVQSYPIKTVDTTEEGLATWCRKVWAKKERRLSGFYEENQNFEMNKAAGDNFCAVEPRCLPSPNVQVHMYAALILYFSLIFVALYFIVFCSLVRWYAFLCFVIFSAIGYFCDGVDMVQTKLAKPLVA